MTVLTELNAIALTASAKSGVSTKGHNVGALVALAKQHVSELKVVLAQLIALHPTGGGDAANSASLTAILGELA